MNKCIFTGRTTAEPETRYSQDGKPITRFSIAVDDGFGQNKTTSFFDLTAFGNTAESIQKYVGKGTKIAVVTRARQNTWTDKNGQKRSSVGFTVENWEFAESKQNAAQNAAQSATQPAPTVPEDFYQIPEGIDEELPFN